MMNNNFIQFMQAIKQNGNPQHMIMNILQNTAQTNPMAENLLNLVQSGNGTGIEQVARNMCKSQGKDFDKEFNAFKQIISIK